MQTYSRVYDTYSRAQTVVNELIQRGVPQDDVSLIGRQSTGADDEMSGTANGATVGGAIGAGAGLLTGIGLMAIPGVGPVVAAGWLASTLAGAAAGAVTGGIVGALTDAGTSEDDAHVYAEAIRRGGTLVTVRSRGGRDAEIKSIMDRVQPVDTQTRREEYRNAGWDKFDPALPPYESADPAVRQTTRRAS